MPYVMLAAAAISIIGSMQSAQDQAEAERKNAAFYREQQLFQQEATARELAIFDRKSRQLKGDQLMSVSSRGLELSASSMELLASESVAMDSERFAIQREGEFKQRLAGLRAEQSNQTASDLTGSSMYLRAAGQGMTMFAQSGIGKGEKPPPPTKG